MANLTQQGSIVVSGVLAEDEVSKDSFRNSSSTDAAVASESGEKVLNVNHISTNSLDVFDKLSPSLPSSAMLTQSCPRSLSAPQFTDQSANKQGSRNEGESVTKRNNQALVDKNCESSQGQLNKTTSSSHQIASPFTDGSRVVADGSYQVVLEMAPGIFKVCPSVGELETPIMKDIPCPVKDCTKICAQSSALRFHLEKTHRIIKEKDPWQKDSGSDKPTVHWHCPHPECIYGLQKVKYFSSRPLLKQHYGKMHLQKLLKCEGCGRMFGPEKDHRLHIRSCGTRVYTCTCGVMYMMYESYINHCHSNNHEPDPEMTPPVEKKKPQKSQTTKESTNKLDEKCENKSTDNVGAKESSEDNKLTEAENTKKKKIGKKRGRYKKTKSIAKADASGPRKLPTILPNPNLVILVMADGVGESTDAAMKENLEHEASGQKCLTNAVPQQLIYLADATSSDKKNWQVGNCGRGKHKRPKPVVVSRPQPLDVSDEILNEHVVVDRDEQITQDGGESESADTEYSDADSMKREQHAVRMTAGTQTPTTRGQQTVAQTQTTGDFILRRAMQCADLPIQRESRASQVSPRAKVKRSNSRAYQSIETQTIGVSHPPVKRRRKKLTKDCETITSVMNSTMGTGLQTLSLPNSWSADTQTQTIALLDELEARFSGESISTQTLDSFLLSTSHDPSDPHVLTNTVDQAVLCDLGLTHDLVQPPNVVNAATSPRARIRPPTLTVDCGTEPLVQVPAANVNLTSRFPDNPLARSNTFSPDSQNIATTAHSLQVSNLPVSMFRTDNSSLLTINHSNSCTNTVSTEKGNLTGTVPGGMLANQTSIAMPYSVLESDFVGRSNSQYEPRCSNDILDVCKSSQLLGRDAFMDAVSVPISVQTDLYSSSDINMSTQTTLTDLQFPELLTSSVQTSDFDTSYMNIETQTADSDMLDQFLSNMQTQTTDDFLADLGFSDIETQTNYAITMEHQLPNVATETIQTQTMMSSTNELSTLPSIGIQTQTISHAGQQVSPLSVGIQTGHIDQQGATLSMDMETQTLLGNMELCPDLSDSFTQTAYSDLESFVSTLS